MSRTAWVAGGSGLVGRALLEELGANPSWNRVIALVRRRLSVAAPKVEQVEVDFDRLGQAARELAAVDDVFCCLGTTIKKAGGRDAFARVDRDYPLALGERARAAGAKQLVIVTAMGANARSSIFYNRVKGEVEEGLRAVGLPSLTIVRPSILVGDREEVRRGERAGIAVMSALGPLLPKRYRPVEARAVARAMVAAAVRAEPGVHVVESDRIHAGLAGHPL